MTPTACNYDPTWTYHIASDCIFPVTGYDCDGVCLLDTDGDGVCDMFEIPGCTDPVACNYDEDADTDDGSCSYDDADGDGVCDMFEVIGCMDNDACNYDSSATDESGACTYPEVGYDCNGNCLADYDGDGICDEPITVSFDTSLSGGQSTSQNMVLSGNLTQVQFNLNFSASGAEWPADMIVVITGANGNCMAGEGYNINPPSTCYDINFPGYWTTTANGFYTYTMSALPAGLSGDGTWVFDLQNGYAEFSSNANYDLDIVLFGVTEFVE